MNIRLTVAKNTVLLTLSEAISRGSKFFLLIYAARVLGSKGFGEFNFALSFVSLLVIAADLGLSSITTRDLARDTEKEQGFSMIFSLRIFLCAIVYLLTVGISFLITDDPLVRTTISILAAFVLTNNLTEIIFAFLRARQRMLYEAETKFFQAFVVIGLGFYILNQTPSVQNFAWSYLAAGAASFLAIFAFFYFKIQTVKVTWDWEKWKSLLAASWPMAIVAASVSIYNYTDSVMLGTWGYIEETGWYNAAYKIAAVTTLPMILAAQSFYPALSKAFSSSWHDLQEIWNDYFILGILIALPLGVGGVRLASEIITFTYGPEYEPAVQAFRILMVGTSSIILMGVISHALIVVNLQKKNFQVATAGALFNIVLNFLLIPKYTFYGAAIATVVTVFFMTAWYTYDVYKFTDLRPFNQKTTTFLIIAGASSILMYLIIEFASLSLPSAWLTLIPTVLLGGAAYSISCLILYKLIWKNI